MLVAGLFLVVGLGIVVWSLASFRSHVTRDVTFAAAFTHFAVMFGTFNVLDWLVLDWSLVYWQPRFVVLPGTEGMAGYRSYWFHFRGFLIGIPIVLVGKARSWPRSSRCSRESDCDQRRLHANQDDQFRVP